TNNIFLYSTIGGVQRVNATVLSISTDGNTAQISASYVYRIMDTFGAGTTDGTRALLPGLVQTYVLQHYRNTNNKSLYRPYMLGVDVKR
ncbi:MAG TPA: hypothetical protein VF691_21390, partial [Cytophagaceae bacterium]